MAIHQSVCRFLPRERGTEYVLLILQLSLYEVSLFLEEVLSLLHV